MPGQHKKTRFVRIILGGEVEMMKVNSLEMHEYDCVNTPRQYL